jgi:hypothetical protein
MNRRVRVKINMTALVRHLSREEKREVPEDDVVRWLKAAGFTAAGDVWIVAEADLGHLDPSEVVAIEPLDDASH